MSDLQFPTFLFAPTSVSPRLTGAAASGGRSMGGVEQVAEFSGGGLWTVTFGEANLWRRAKFMSWRALDAALGNGATPCIVPIGDRRHQPLVSPPVSQAFNDEALWVDGSSWSAVEVTASFGAAALRATSATITYGGAVSLIGGEFFSILHPTQGWRMYCITRVEGSTITFRPPLREAIGGGTALNFESPRFIGRLVGDPQTVLEMLRFGKGGPISFVEAFPYQAA